jgi:hypothetical protein
MPWAKHAEPDEMEWPPHPCAIVGLLIDTWHRLGRPSPNVFLCLLGELRLAPIYYIPRATAGDSAHPNAVPADPSPIHRVVLDSFIAIDKERSSKTVLCAVWEHAEPAPEGRMLLDALSNAINAREVFGEWRWLPSLAGDRTNWVRVSPIPGANVIADGFVVRRRAFKEEQPTSHLLVNQYYVDAKYQPVWLNSQCDLTWVTYVLPPDLLMVREQYEDRERQPLTFAPICLRFQVQPQGPCTRLPISKTILIAEVMRRAVMSRYSALYGGPVTTRLAGKKQNGKGKREGHDHPFFLPIASKDPAVIDLIDVWFPSGCTHAEYRSVVTITTLRERSLWNGRLMLRYIGHSEYPASTHWVTSTPIILERFPKMRGRKGNRWLSDAPAEQVQRMLARHTRERFVVQIMESDQMEWGTDLAGGGAFILTRPGRQLKYPAVGASVGFAKPVKGPIVLGRLAHFGLGQFRPSAS